MFDLFRKENLTQEQRLLKHLMKNEGKEVTLSSIVVGLKIFHHQQIIAQLRKIGRDQGFIIENRLDRSKDKFGNMRSFYRLIKD